MNVLTLCLLMIVYGDYSANEDAATDLAVSPLLPSTPTIAIYFYY